MKAGTQALSNDAPASATLLARLRAAARAAPASGIVEVMDYGRRRGGVLGLWAGEGDLATPAFITDAAARALAAGETFYTWQRGLPELRAAASRAITPASMAANLRRMNSSSPAPACRRSRLPSP
jgi:hypothetical protein